MYFDSVFVLHQLLVLVSYCAPFSFQFFYYFSISRREKLLRRLIYDFCCLCNYCGDVLLDLVPIVPFKKRKKHPWKSILLVKLQALSNTPQWAFFTIFKIVQIVPNRTTHHSPKTEAYPELAQQFKMKSFATIVNSLR